jgi:hypothetical protein
MAWLPADARTTSPLRSPARSAAPPAITSPSSGGSRAPACRPCATAGRRHRGAQRLSAAPLRARRGGRRHEHQPQVAAIEGAAREQPAHFLEGADGFWGSPFEAGALDAFAAAQPGFGQRSGRRAAQHRLGSCTPSQLTAAYSSTASSRLAAGPAATMAAPGLERLGVEGQVPFGGVDGRLALVQHLHVAAERERADHELGVLVRARLARLPAPKGLAEADGEAQHLDAAGDGHAVVAVLVHAMSSPSGTMKAMTVSMGLQLSGQGEPAGWPGRRRRGLRVEASRSAAMPAWRATASKVARFTWWIWSKRMRRSRKAATATSLAAFSTAVRAGRGRQAVPGQLAGRGSARGGRGCRNSKSCRPAR